MTDALWWLVCMRIALEPDSANGGTFARKAGYHNAGELLPAGDHSIRWSWDRSGPWWKKYTSAHDWTFRSAQRGDYRIISKYTKRLISAMKDPKDKRPEEVYAYTLGQIDNDRTVEGWNERTDEDETSGDLTHNWHRHDSFRRNIIGSFPHMWRALTIDMGWTYEEYLRSVAVAPRKAEVVKFEASLPLLRQGDSEDSVPGGTTWIHRAQTLLSYLGGYPADEVDGIYGPKMSAAVKTMMKNDPTRSHTSGIVFGEPEWRRAIGAWK